MKEFVTPTPRDQRIRVLSSLTRDELYRRAIALGYDFTGPYDRRRYKDDLIAMILDAETDRGMVAR